MPVSYLYRFWLPPPRGLHYRQGGRNARPGERSRRVRVKQAADEGGETVNEADDCFGSPFEPPMLPGFLEGSTGHVIHSSQTRDGVTVDEYVNGRECSLNNASYIARAKLGLAFSKSSSI